MVSRLRIVVLGMMGRCPFGGQTWLYLNWLRGLHRLGHDVWYAEDDTVWPYDPVRNAVTDNCGYAVRHVAGSMERIGMAGKWAYRLAGVDDACWGLSPRALDGLYANCDVLLNIVGATDLREEHMAAPLRVYVESDPVTAELQLANGDEHTRRAFDSHHILATYGEKFGDPDCGVPLNGRSYIKTRQPVDLDLWPDAYSASAVHVTTIGNYRQSGSDVDHLGETYRWSKHHEWLKVMDLPSRVRTPFLLAMMPDDPADAERFRSHGWELTAPLQMSLDVFGAYPEFIRSSRAEFTVAKDQNVRLRSGWFSERDACYLASGKPVVAQDTGFSDVLPTGQGLFAFTTVEEAAGALREIEADYERHARAARALACEAFEARMVAGKLLADIGVG